MTDERSLFVIGSYTEEDGDGLTSYSVDSRSIERHDVANEVDPSFLDIHPSESVFIAVNEREDGSAVSYRINPTNGRFNYLDETETGDDGPCHIAIDPCGEYAIVSHYVGGSVALLSVGTDGSLNGPIDLRDHEGSGPNEDRQSSAHPHSAWFVTNSTVYVPDLGADQVVVYELDRTERCLRLVPDATINCRPGAGPRHFAMHPNASVGYLVNELDATLSVVDFDTLRQPKIRDTYSTLPNGVDVSDTTAAGVHVHPSGNYVFVSNRGHDSIATFECRGSPRQVTRKAVTPTTGQWPRDFAIHPDGNQIFVCHQRSNDLVTFECDIRTGELRKQGSRMNMNAPTCLQFC
ncbi:lactonase family protein [Halococcus sp. PRR34]|uniref:lactonase family protein n=1 Tax=Halococcus sp. PRR34 TaxID=3020830 RepID=UPI00236092DC|nr:lactonase family protein [Halococcus sp. PRR34]